MVLRSVCLLVVGLPFIVGGIMPDTARAASIKAPKKVAAVFPPVASSESGRDLEGFVAPKYTLSKYEEIHPALQRPKVKALYEDAAAPPVKTINLFATPFPVDTSGNINARGPRKKKYTGVRF